MEGLFLFLIGYRVLRLDRQWAAELMTLCGRRGIVCRNPRFEGGSFFVSCGWHSTKRLLAACEEQGIPVEIHVQRGVPSLICRYHRRAGILVGSLAFAAVLFFSGRVVWSVRVEGNETLRDEDVAEALKECGLSVGRPIRELDTAMIENQILIGSDEISWISINMIGTVARVEIRETVPFPEEERYMAANLVAARSGKIEWLEDVRGNVAIRVGDSVGEGDLLVGGIYEIPNGGLRTTCARGKVFARTERTFEVKIPLMDTKKSYTGVSKTKKSLIFFEKEINFFGNTRNSYANCDTIDTVEYWTLPGGIVLPVGIRTTRVLEYELTATERSMEAAMELALYRLRCRMEAEAPDGFLTQKTMWSEQTENAYLLRCRAEYIENIAKMQEIEIEGLLGNGAKNSND